MSLFTDLSVFEEVQGDLYILQLVEAHATFLPWLQETRGHQTWGGGSTWLKMNKQQGPMTEEKVFQYPGTPFCAYNNIYSTVEQQKHLTVMATTSKFNFSKFEVRFKFGVIVIKASGQTRSDPDVH